MTEDTARGFVVVHRERGAYLASTREAPVEEDIGGRVPMLGLSFGDAETVSSRGSR